MQLDHAKKVMLHKTLIMHQIKEEEAHTRAEVTVRSGVARGRGHGFGQSWRAPGSNLVIGIGGGTNPHMSSFQKRHTLIYLICEVNVKLINGLMGETMSR